MTFCISGICEKGIVFLSDTRTNGGVDNISTFKKLHYYKTKNPNLEVVLSHAGSVSTCREVVTRVEQMCRGVRGNPDDLLSSSFGITAAVGRELRQIISESQGIEGGNRDRFTASLLIGTKYKGEIELYRVYPEGNFIQATMDVPFLQIGESKYSRALLNRYYNSAMHIEELLQLFRDALEMTIVVNLSVGYPADYIMLSANDTTPEQGRFLDTQDIDLFSKYVDFRFSGPANKYPERHLAHLVTLADRVSENVKGFRENIRSSNLLDDKSKAHLFRVADRIEILVRELKADEFFSNSKEENEENRATWLYRYGAALRSQFEILTSPELLGEKTIPLGLLVSFSSLGFAVGGGLGAALGALTARAISTKNDITKDIQELLSRD